MLQLVYGGAGCGKTTYARSLACELAQSGGRAVMIVPEQFSFETERAMLGLLGAREANRVRIYSFTRLAEEVSRISNAASGRRLDDCGRVAAMGAALTMLGGQLDYYGGKQPSSSFIDHLLDAVKEFKLFAITPEMLAKTAEQADGTLRRKLTELAAVFGAYEAVVAQTSLDPLDDLTRLFTQLGEHRFFEGTTVILDSFRSFTGQEMKIISRIIEQSEKCVVTICSETADKASDSGLFETAFKTAEALKALASQSGTPVAPSVLLGTRHRFASSALAAVEAGVFRYGNRPEPYTEPTGDVVIYEADSRYGEMEYCARECRRLLREDGFRCRDIAIIARAESTYSDMAYDALTMQEIPCFLDRRTDASSCALMQFVLSALDIVCRGWQSDDLMRWLKTGLVGGTDAQTISELENYCFVWRLSGRDWRSPFTQNPAGFSALLSDEDARLLERINALREHTITLLGDFSAALENANGFEMAQALFGLLEKAETPRLMDELCARLDEAEANEQAQLWDALMSILDQIASIIGKNKLTKENFAAYIALMINRCDIGSIPRGLDDVVFGGAERMRVSAPRAVFIVGAIDGEFPSSQAGSGVFTDDERKRLHDELLLPVAEPVEHRLLEERLMAYSVLSSASERLYITYPKCSDGDGAAFASECVAEVLKCVPNAKREYPEDSFDVGSVEAAPAAFELAARYWNADGGAAALAQELKKEPSAAAKLKAVEASADRSLPTLSNRKFAEGLFGGSMRISPSQAEQFHRCRFGYFCKYGLRVRPRGRAELDRLRFGSIVHYVLEHILGSAQGDIASLSGDEEKTGQRVAELLEAYLNDEMGGEEGKSASLLSQLRRMRPSLTGLVMNIAEELSFSDFQPVAYELKIDSGGEVKPSYIKLPGGGSLSVTGIVDRVDCWQNDGKTYIRVVDYKTGSKDFVLSDVVDGLNMQMLIYTGELCREGNGKFERAVPAGILYCPAYSGTLPGARDDTEAKIGSARESSLKRKGVIIDGSKDSFVCGAMEHGLGGRFIPVKRKGDGTLDSFSPRHIITPAGYDIVDRFIRHKLARMGGELAEGHVAPDPIADNFDQCGNCDYYDVCRYDGGRRERFKGNNEQTLMTMAAALNEGGEEE